MVEITETSVLSKVTVKSLLSNIPSGIGLDIAKNHTGVVIWNGEITEEYGFALSEFDSTDYFGEYKMRRELKQKLGELVNGRHFEVCIIEDVYGGDNFDTVRKLLALNTVIDELIFDRRCTIGEFYRWAESEWLSKTRHLYKQRGKLKSKIETQGILEYLEWGYYLEHKDDSTAKKKEIFFEDICDACGMLLGVVASKLLDINIAKRPNIKLSDIKMLYIEDLGDLYGVKDERMRYEAYIPVELNFRTIEKSIIAQVAQHPDDLLCAFLPSSKLGVFGVQQKFRFFDSDEGYLVFYKRR